MTAAVVMPERPECHSGNQTDPGGVWASPNALAQLFSFHVIKDLNFLSQVIKLSVAETLQPGVLTKIQLSCQGREETCSNGSEDKNGNVAAPEDVSVNHQPGLNASLLSGDFSEDWDAELPQDPPKVSYGGWDDNPRMKKLYNRKMEYETSVQKERDEERMQLSENSLDDSRSSLGTWEESDNSNSIENHQPAKQLDMNKVVKGGRKLFVRNINFKTTQHKLWEFFKKFGRVKNCELMKDRHTKRSRGIAFVIFDKKEECEEVLSATEEELTLQDWVLQVEVARPKKNESKSDVLSQPESLSQETAVLTEHDERTAVTESGSACDILTDDALLHVFAYLELRQLTNCERVCKKWRKLALQSWKSLQELTLQGLLPTFHSVDDRAFRSMLAKCSPSLTTIDLSVSARTLSDYSLDAIARYCPNVEDVHLVSLQITNRGFEKFVKKCTRIRKIDIEHCSDVREDGIWRLFNCCRDLREVQLNNCKRVVGQCFHVMAGGVVSMSLSGCLKLQDVAMAKLSIRCKNLQELHLDGCTRLTDTGLENLAKNEVVDTLQVLNLGRVYPHMSPQGLHKIAEFVNLQEVYLFDNNLVRDETLQKLGVACTSLRVLDIGGCGSRITDNGLLSLPVSLECLTINYLSSVTDEGLELIADNCSNLKSLKARFCLEVTDAGVTVIIRGCPRLRELDVCGCFFITNKIMHELVQEVEMRDLPRENVIVMAGGTSVVASELTLPPSITLNIIAFNPTSPDFDVVPLDFDSDEDSFDDDDFDDFLVSDDPFLVSEMEMS